MPTYLTTCPHCGSGLTPVAQGPSAAPWLCRDCHLGWWSAELSDDARAAWDPHTQCFHRKSGVREAVKAEVEQANQRGVSLREDQLGLVPVRTLSALITHRITAEMATAMRSKIEEVK